MEEEKNEFPLFAKLSEEGEKEVESIVEGVKKKLKKVKEGDSIFKSNKKEIRLSNQ